jgi:4-amino-4-deoxy-L-arabinose transferase-like glycosyltransferase
VPICGPGLALVMAGAFLVHREAVFLVVPVFAAGLVWLTFVFGRRVDDEVTGACAAVLLACSPIFLYQAVQPMTDVPAAALWMAALTAAARLPAEASAKAGGDRRGQVLGGLCASLAVLMRPNFALVVLPLLFLLPGRRSFIRFALAAAPAAAIMAGLNMARYGAPLASGYGDTGTLFSVAHLAPNAARYSRWLLETHTPFLLLALAAPWMIPRVEGKRRLALVSLAGCALIVATYLAYTVFEDWWYIRFLLPALPILLALGVAVALRLTEWLPPVGGGSIGGRSIAAVILCVALGGWYVHVARARQVLDLQSLESRFAITGRHAGRMLPSNAVVLSVQQSGSVRFHGGRDTIAWDAIPPHDLDRTIATIRSAGRVPVIVLEDGEEPAFRRRFSTQRFGGLDWPPQVEIHAPVRVHFYDPAARDRYRAGQRVETEHVR